MSASLAFVPRSVGQPRRGQSTTRKQATTSTRPAAVPTWPTGCCVQCSFVITARNADSLESSSQMKRSAVSYCERLVPRSCAYVQVEISKDNDAIDTYCSARIRCVSPSHAQRLMRCLNARRQNGSSGIGRKAHPDAIEPSGPATTLTGDDEEKLWLKVTRRSKQRARRTAIIQQDATFPRRRKRRRH